MKTLWSWNIMKSMRIGLQISADESGEWRMFSFSERKMPPWTSSDWIFALTRLRRICWVKNWRSSQSQTIWMELSPQCLGWQTKQEHKHKRRARNNWKVISQKTRKKYSRVGQFSILNNSLMDKDLKELLWPYINSG